MNLFNTYIEICSQIKSLKVGGEGFEYSSDNPELSLSDFKFSAKNGKHEISARYTIGSDYFKNESIFFIKNCRTDILLFKNTSTTWYKNGSRDIKNNFYIGYQVFGELAQNTYGSYYYLSKSGSEEKNIEQNRLYFNLDNLINSLDEKLKYPIVSGEKYYTRKNDTLIFDFSPIKSEILEGYNLLKSLESGGGTKLTYFDSNGIAHKAGI